MQNKIFIIPYIPILLLLLFTGVHAQESYLSERWETIEFGEYLGASGLASLDIDGNDIEEIIMTGSFNNETYFCILEITEKEFVVKWSSRLYAAGAWDNANIRRLKPYNLDGDDDFEIYVLSGNGLFECYDGSTMEIIHTEVLDAELASDFLFDDVDADGNLDLILTSDHYEVGKYIKIFDATDYSLTWETDEYGDYLVTLGDVDHDNVKEIVLSNGIVIDGITKNLDWEYPDGFGWEIQLEDIDGDQYDEIIAGMNDSIRAYDGLLQERLWGIFTDNRCAALLVDDLNGDGTMEIVHGDFDRDGLKCYNATTQELIWHCEDAESNISQISLGDPDNDNEKELLWGTGHGSTGPDYLMITTANTGINERHTLDLDGYFSFGISDMNKDNQLELGMACYETNSYLNGGNLFIYDGVNHELLDVIDSMSYTSPISCMKMYNINDTEQDEIILGYSDGYGYKSIMILDGLTYEVLYESNDYGSIYSLEVADIDGDGIVEIVFGNHSSLVRIINGETYELEWETEDIGWYQYLVRQIFLENIDDDGALEVIYWCENDLFIHAYDGKTGLEQASSEHYDLISAIDVSDINMDGQMEVCMADKNGHVTVLDGSLQNVLDQFFLQDEAISSIKFCNIDQNATKEILCGSSRFRVFSGNHHYMLWESKRLLEDESNYVTTQFLNAVDLDQNGRMDVFCGNRRGLFQYEGDEEYIDYTPSFNNSDSRWNVASTCPDSQNPGFIKTNTKVYAFLSDTNINGEEWLMFYSSADTNFTSELTYLGNIIEKDGHVQLMEVDKSIRTIYNFNLSVGDEVTYDFVSGSEILQIENIDSIFIDGEYLKRFHFSEPAASPYFLKEIWIEGIGSVHGPLFPVEPTLFSSELPDSTNLSCYQVANAVLWHNSYYETCYVSNNLSIRDEDKDWIRIFPNPVNDVLNISLPENINGKATISILDILGKEIQKTSFAAVSELSISTTSLASGIYFIKLKLDAEVYVKKILRR